MQPLFTLRDRVILLTGSTGHLGRAIARGFCHAGATLILNARSAEKVSLQADSLAAEGWHAEAAVFDVTDEQQRRQSVTEIGRRHGRIDALINNAYAAPESENAAAFRSAYEVSVLGAWSLIQDSLDLLVRAAARNAGGASIVNVASMYGVVSPDFRIYTAKTKPNPSFYGPAKAGLIQLTRYLACELGPKRIRVNAISPGAFPAPSVGRADPEFLARLEAKNPLGRIGQPEELVGPLVFLASDASSYITGANLAVDGGWTAW